MSDIKDFDRVIMEARKWVLSDRNGYVGVVSRSEMDRLCKNFGVANEEGKFDVATWPKESKLRTTQKFLSDAIEIEEKQ